MNDRLVEIDGKTISLTNLDKIFWPDSGTTKGELIAYYDAITEFILPHLKDRPESLNRFPDGITGEHFFQKNINKPLEWMRIYEVMNESDNKQIKYVVCNNKLTLIYLINTGCIDLNVWNSRTPSPDNPDFMVFDLDPIEIDFKYVCEAALKIRETLDSLGIKSYPKTSGKRGIHIYVPLAEKYSFDQVKDFAFLIALKVNSKLPTTTSLEHKPKDRVGKVYIDYLQNRKGATMAVPYSVRPVKFACVSTPLFWHEIEKGVDPIDFTIKNVPSRLKKIGDIFAPVLKKGISLESALERISNIK